MKTNKKRRKAENDRGISENIKECSGISHSPQREILLLFFLFLFVFLLLYCKYFSANIYAFTDVGADTINSYYPSYYYIAQNLMKGNWSYVLTSLGGGVSIASFFPFLLEPFIFLLFIIPPSYLNIFIILQLFLKMLTICLFSYLYYSRQFKKSLPRLATSLLWTYSGYVVLWGQHYHFLTAVMYFTVFMYLLDGFLEDPKKYAAWLTLIAALFCACNVYFFYMSGLFAIGYVIYKTRSKKEEWKNVLKQELWFALIAIGGVLISAACTIPWIETFLASNRTSGFQRSFFTGFDLQGLFSAVQRLFSNNTMGDAENYTGYKNYYEVGMYCTSGLIICALANFITDKRTRIRCMIGIVSACLMVTFTFPSYLLNFNPGSQRWSYLVTFVCVLVIGYFLNNMDTLKNMPRALLFGDIACMGIMLLSGVFAKWYHVNLNYKVMFLCFVFILMYGIVILFSVRTENRKRWLKTGILGLVCVELIALNYPTVNSRASISVQALNKSCYNDGTAQVVQQIKNCDNTFYRINKGYFSVFLDDSLVQGYNSPDSYSSLNTASYTKFLKSLGLFPAQSGIFGNSANFLYIPPEDFVADTLLDTKYVISNGSYTMPFGFHKIFSPNSFAIYQNNYISSIGYAYFDEISQDKFNGLNEQQKKMALLSGFYFTDSSLQKNANDSVTAKVQHEFATADESLCSKFGTLPEYSKNCKVSLTEQGTGIMPTTSDPMMSFKLKKRFDTPNGVILTFQLKTSKNNTMEIYWDDSDGTAKYTEEKCIRAPLYAGKNDYMVGIPAKKITHLRIDPVINTAPVEISNMALNTKLADEYVNKTDALQKVSLQNAQFSASKLTGTVNNTADEEGMMCIPFGYSKAWHLAVNGKPQQIYNINGGLVGFVIPKGTSSIELSYYPVTLCFGITVSVIALLVFIGVLLWKKSGNKKRRVKNDTI